MATYVRRAGITSCMTCHAVVGHSWREFAEHSAACALAGQLAARQARIDALTNQERRAS